MHRDGARPARQEAHLRLCLGHQLLGLALAARPTKLNFGHRGANQPVLHQQTGQVEITTQNHGFAVDIDSLSKDVELTHINLNDRTLKACATRKCRFQRAVSPRVIGGPHDSSYLFNDFRKLMDDDRTRA